MRRYGSLSYPYSLNIEEALSFIDFAFEKQTEELIFQRWIPYQHISYEEFKAQIKPQEIKQEKEILKDVEKIITLFNTGRGE